MKPVIGITMAHNTTDNKFFINNLYLNAIIKSGGIPLLLSPLNKTDTEQIINKIDGLLLTGGGDLNPILLGLDPVKEIGEISTKRDEFELILTKIAIKKNIPILGICRGMQVMALASGAKLYQDIYTSTNSTICHSQKSSKDQETHFVYLKENTLIYDIFKEEKISVNSFHHQSLETAGDLFFESGHSSDGIIESIEAKTGFFVGVQWHPEALYETNKLQQNLFKTFIKNC